MVILNEASVIFIRVDTNRIDVPVGIDIVLEEGTADNDNNVSGQNKLDKIIRKTLQVFVAVVFWINGIEVFWVDIPVEEDGVYLVVKEDMFIVIMVKHRKEAWNSFIKNDRIASIANLNGMNVRAWPQPSENKDID